MMVKSIVSSWINMKASLAKIYIRTYLFWHNKRGHKWAELVWRHSYTHAHVHVCFVWYKAVNLPCQRCCRGVIVWLLDLQLTMQSVPITTDFVSSNLDQGKVYNIIW